MNTSICSIKSLINEILTHKKALMIGNVLALFSTLLTAIIPLFIPIIVDELLLNQNHGFIDFIATYIFTSDIKGYVFFVLFLMLLLRIISAFLSIMQSKIFTIISKNITYNMRLSLLKHLKLVSLKEYEMMRVGAVTSKLVTDVETVDNFISSTISKLIMAVLVLIFSSAILFWIDWKLALFIILTNPIVLVFTSKLSRNVGKLKKEENKAVELFQASLSETLELFHQIRASNKENYFFDKSMTKAKELKEHAIAFGYKSEMAIKLSILVFLSGYEVFRAVSILAVAYSDLSVGLMLGVFSYLWIMVTPIQDIINFQYALATAKSACKRINSIYDMQKEPQIEQKTNPFENNQPIDIEIKNLSFAYQKEKTILKDVNIKIKKHSKVAIVGASGSGKTTLANIIVGFYPLDSGEIIYGGISNKNLKLSTIREHIHLILQNPKLFNDTMLFNLTLGNDYKPKSVQKALEIAQLSSVIDNLDKGLDTIIGKDGIKLSGGQRQRVAIARMILANPSVVILDESTSAIDVHTEVRLFEALEEFLRDKTVITIAHRLSTIKSAEYIFVLEDSIVVDSGTPKELLNKDKSYFSSMI